MHALLLEQLKLAGITLESLPKDVQDLLAKIDAAYERQIADSLIFQKAAESSADAVAILDDKGMITYTNPSWQTLTGYTSQESIGKDLSMLRSNKTSIGTSQALDEALRNHTQFGSDDLVHHRKDGTEYYVSLHLYPANENGTARHFVALQQDITARKISDTSKSEFVSLVSHQLRTPLTSIIWNLEILQDIDLRKLPPDQISTLIGSTHRSSKRMAETIDTLMQLSNLEVGKTQPNFTQVELVTLFETVRSEQLPEYLKKEQQITIDCPATMTLSTDPALLKEVLSNLLNNSVKYTPAKGTMTLRATRKDDQVLIEVQDTGYGILARQQDKVFSKFFRGDNVRYIENTGNGLGLYLVKNLIELLRGTITFRSEENKGTTFIITLPFQITKETTPALETFVK